VRTGHHIPRRAFTVVELLVAIAIVAIIATGLSVIFGSVGDAVTDGRRASEINRAAARIEQQIRDDLSRLTRDGYLVIANRYASNEQGEVFSADSGNPNAPGARLSPQDRTGRARRADELMFFARGQFQTKRPTLAPGMIATAGEAAVYFGIGQKRPIDFSNVNTPNNFYFNPTPTDPNLLPARPGQGWRGADRALLGRPDPTGALPNPNRYAQDWSLLRQVTLLAEPQSVSVIPTEFYGLRRDRLEDRTLMLDSARQIAMQPAARSIFNSLSWTNPALTSGRPGTAAADAQSRWWIGDIANFGAGQSPADRSLPAWRASGVTDIAQGSILGIRRELEALSAANIFPSDYYPPVAVNPASPRPARNNQSADGFRVEWADPASSPRPQNAESLDLDTHRSQIRAWALDMLPSLWAGEENPPRYLAGVRYEDLPTRLILEPGRFADTNPGRLARAIAESNQEMLGAQVFVPRCSEFIVEWSYGFIEESYGPGDARFKQLRWHGLRRADRDLNNDGRIDLNDHATNDPEELAASRYLERPDVSSRPDDPRRNQVIPAGPAQTALTDPEVAVFGLTGFDTSISGGNTRRFVIPWPKFIRITMSLADPDDPTIERTYQFVFAVPGDQA
jgi:prepilin-type N-terminal cleavage/methylation domain-containing protein